MDTLLNFGVEISPILGVVQLPVWLIAAIIGQSAIQSGIGIWKTVKGAKMEKQSLSNREKYINEMYSLLGSRQKGFQSFLGEYVEQQSKRGIPTIGDLDYSSLQRGREQEKQQISSYMGTISEITKSPISEKNFMSKKFGLNR